MDRKALSVATRSPIHPNPKPRYFSPRCEQFSTFATLSKCRHMTEPWNIDCLVVARAIAGDRAVLDGVLTALQRPLYRYISRLLTHHEMAEDALQEVLFRICRKIVWLRDPELLRPWAFRIATRECFRQLRLEKRRAEEILDMDALEMSANDSIPQEWEPRLLDWVDDLPPASRAVIMLHYLEEMSLQEVAAVLEILPGTVKSRLAYGLARLRRRAAGAQMIAGGGTHP